MGGQVGVLVVDDSAFMRRMVTTILSADPEIKVVGQAKNGAEAVEMVQTLQPDAITLDIEMPGMDGLQALYEIMLKRPTPVVMLSSLTQVGARAAIRCLQLGAIDCVGKPSGSLSLDIEKVGEELVAKVKAAASARVSRTRASGSARAMMALPPHPKTKCLFIGSSTGGPKALQQLVPKLPQNLGVPVVIVQHMPAGFTRALADRLAIESRICVREAQEGDRLEPNVALVAQGGMHLEITRAGTARLTEGAAVNGVKPSADVTLNSLVSLFGGGVIGVVLTGMGRDGADAMKALHDKGGLTFVESEETCVVYGMPRAVVEMNAADQILPIGSIAAEVVRAIRPMAAA